MEKQTAVVQKKKGLGEGFKKELRSALMVVFVALFMINFAPITAFAGDTLPGVDKLSGIIGWIADWAGRIGIAVAFFGALQTALGFMQDDADAKVRGMKVMAAGFMVYGVSEIYNTFFLTEAGEVITGT